jgi:hypothetical protein
MITNKLQEVWQVFLNQIEDLPKYTKTYMVRLGLFNCSKEVLQSKKIS